VLYTCLGDYDKVNNINNNLSCMKRTSLQVESEQHFFFFV
jgi:hypothetical protein